VTISGSLSTDATKVTFCDVEATVQSQTTDKIVVNTGAAPDFFSNCDVKIVTAGFGTLTGTNVFSYTAGMLASYH